MSGRPHVWSVLGPLVGIAVGVAATAGLLSDPAPPAAGPPPTPDPRFGMMRVGNTEVYWACDLVHGNLVYVQPVSGGVAAVENVPCRLEGAPR